MTTGADAAWERLAPGFRTALDEAWRSLAAEGLPVGAAITRDDEVLASGRNRVYDPPGGPEPLQRTPIAHAEMNALAVAPEDAHLGSTTLWSTHAPCQMCRAALDLAAIPDVRYLATDPSDDGLAEPLRSSGDADDVWIVVAAALFLHNVARVGGRDHRIVRAAREHEPATVRLALAILDDGAWVRAARDGSDITSALAPVWDDVAAAHLARW